MFLLGLGIYLVGTGFLIVWLGGHVQNFIDLASLLLLVASVLAALTATGSFRVFGRGLRAAALPKAPLSEETRGQAASLFRLLSKVTVMAMGVAGVICTINILISFSTMYADPVALNKIGPNFAAALITPLHGLLLIGAVFEPVVFILKKRR